jgi:cobalt-zinc-cadmium efflux system protein
LLGVVAFIFFEAVGRLFNPEEIAGGAMIVTAVIALIGNGIATYLLEKDAHENLNMKSAWLHSLQDALFSLGVVVGSVLIYFFHWYFIDPIISILLSIYILKAVYGLIRQTVDILMESVPTDIDFEKVKAKLEQLPKVIKAHDIHIWQTDSSSRFLSAHLETEDIKNGDRNQLLCDIQDLLQKDFKISHTTIQLVAGNGKDGINLKCNHCN